MSRGSHALCWTAALLAAAAPLPFGAVGPLAEALVQLVVLGAAVAWIGLRRRAGLSPLPWRDPLLLAGAALLLYGLIQIVPYPASLVELVSPAGAALKREFAPAPPAWTALSLYPYATWRSCLNIATWTLAALLVRHNAIDLKGRLVVAGGLVAGGLFQAGYGLFEFISGRQQIFGFKKEAFTDVATGTFVSRNNFAAYLEMAIPMALALAMLALDRSRPRAGAGIHSFRRRLAAAAGRESFHALLLLMGAFLMGTALLMSRSRAGILCGAAALAAGALALGMQGRSRRFAICAVAVVALVVLFASQIDILPVLERFQLLRNEFGEGYGRFHVWQQALPMVAGYPLFGTGMGTWEMAFSPYRTDHTQLRVDFAHNDYLEFAAEAGLVGLVLFAAGASLVLRARVRARGLQDEIGLAAGLGLVALALHSVVDFHMSIPADAFAAAALTGLFLREPGPVPERRAASAPRPRRLAPAWVTAACTAVLLGLGLAAASPAAARMRTEAAPRDDAPEAAEPASPETPGPGPGEELCPECPLEPYNAGRYVDAAARARARLLRDVEALLRAQADGALPDLTSRRYLAGRIEGALELARRAMELAPASGRAHMEAGMLHFGRFALIGLPPAESDEFDLALEEFGKAMSLQPWRAAPHRRVVRLAAPLYDECDAEQRAVIARAARRAAAIDPHASDIRDELGRMGL